MRKTKQRTKDTTETDRVIGMRLRALRNAKGISQTILGDSLGVTFQQVQKYEKGTNRLSGGRLAQCGKIFGVPVAYFFAEENPGDHLVSNPCLELAQSDQGTRVARAFLQMPVAARLPFINFLEVLAERA